MRTNLVKGWGRTISSVGVLVGAALLLFSAFGVHARAATADEFNIQVSPSPLTLTLSPGQSQTAKITVRNFSAHTETLAAKLGGFTIDDNSQSIKLNSVVPGNMSEWVSFDEPSFSLSPGQSLDLGVHFNTPDNVGFSYSFAITLTRVSPEPDLGTPGTHLKGSVAVFCLVNVNRPDAVSKLAIDSFTSNKSRYTFLPAKLSLTVQNQGNIIGQPSGTIFIQRSFNSATSLATLAINPGHGYILPGVSRTFEAQWTNGFPVYISKTVDGKTHLHLSWAWRHLGDLRIGKFVAKAVLVYNNGQQDVPVIASTSFWVVPWLLILVCLVLFGLLITGLVGWGWLIFKGTKKVKRYASHRHKN